MISKKRETSKNLVTQNAYLDTTVFYSANFQYESSAFSRIKEFSKRGKINLYLTNITVREIESHIIRQTEQAIEAIKTCRKRIKILRNIDEGVFGQLFADVNKGIVQQILLDQFHKFLNDASVQVISLANTSVEAVFGKYFNLESPFSEKKKTEFPDAFVVETLIQWCESRVEKMYLISSDNDMKESCAKSDNLIQLEKLDELVDLISKQDNFSVYEFARAALKSQAANIEDRIKIDFESFGFTLMDEDGVVEEVEVDDVTFVSEYLIEANQQTAQFKIEFEVSFTADTVFADMNTAIYDSDEKRPVPMNTIRQRVENITFVTVEVMLSYEAEFQNPDDAFLDSVRISYPFDIDVYVNDN